MADRVIPDEAVEAALDAWQMAYTGPRETDPSDSWPEEDRVAMRAALTADAPMMVANAPEWTVHQHFDFDELPVWEALNSRIQDIARRLPKDGTARSIERFSLSLGPSTNPGGGVTVLWHDRRLLALATVVRTDMNRSVGILATRSILSPPPAEADPHE